MNPLPSRPQKTFADYLAVGISPVLIMLLVGSLAFFLANVFYRGAAIASVRWLLFWFVLAIVLVSRIAIEKSTAHALGYGGALALATCLFLSWITPVFVPGIMVLAITWWCAHKLTFDCTLIDDSVDASGRGVIQDVLTKLVGEPAPAPPVIAGRTPPLMVIPAAPPKSPRAPGRWVVYFSLAALPLFGVGQLFLPNDEPGPRRVGFALLLVYLGAALGLLVTTSFLGLRRYLRQRYLTMPRNVAFGWVRFGVVVIVITLALAILLPRPGADYTWKTLTYQIDQKVHRASDWAFDWNTPGEGDGWPGPLSGPGSSQSREPETVSRPQPPENQPSSSPQPSTTGGGGGQGNDPGGQTGATPQQSPQQQSGSDRQKPEPQSSSNQQRPGQPGNGGDQGRDGNPREGAGRQIGPKQTGGSGGDDGSDNKQQYADRPDQPGNGGSGGDGAGGGGGGGGEPKKVDSQKPTVASHDETEKQPAPREKSRAVNLALLFKILLVTLVAAIILWFAIRYRALIAQMFREFIAMLKRFFSGLAGFRFKRRKGGINQPALPALELPAFSSFSDPFLTGKDSIWPRERLILYTYSALQAWSRDLGFAPRSEETPREFCVRLRANFPEAAAELDHLLVLYTHAAFAETLPAHLELASLQRLWVFLSESARAVSSVPEPAVA